MWPLLLITLHCASILHTTVNSLTEADFRVVRGELSPFVPERFHNAMGPNALVLEYLKTHVRSGDFTRILDYGPGAIPFPPANYIADHRTEHWNHKSLISWSINFNRDKLPVPDNIFDFAYCRHVLEDLNDPENAFYDLVRVSPRGYIETPSPLVETLLLGSKQSFRGYVHHRFFFWTDMATNTLVGLPKFPLIEALGSSLYGIEQEERLIDRVIESGPLWNNYYFWNETHRPRIVILQHDVDYDIVDGGYARVLLEGVQKSIDHTTAIFVNEINSYANMLNRP